MNKIKWRLKGFDKYGITSKSEVINIKTDHVLQRTVKGYTIGYYLSGKFKSLQQIRSLSYKYEKVKCPF